MQDKDVEDRDWQSLAANDNRAVSEKGVESRNAPFTDTLEVHQARRRKGRMGGNVSVQVALLISLVFGLVLLTVLA